MVTCLIFHWFYNGFKGVSDGFDLQSNRDVTKMLIFHWFYKHFGGDGLRVGRKDG